MGRHRQVRAPFLWCADEPARERSFSMSALRGVVKWRVGDIHYDGVAEEAPATMFWPMMQRDFWGNELLIFLHRA